jgi:Domain of unknown function (DUF4189)
MICWRGASRAVAAAGLFISTCLAGASAQAAGALAIGACGAYGLAYDYGATEAANAAALGHCEGQCQVAAAMRKTCAAFSIDGHNACGAYGYAAAPRLGQAQNTALLYCYRNGGKDCVIRAWVCDGKG